MFWERAAILIMKEVACESVNKLLRYRCPREIAYDSAQETAVAAATHQEGPVYRLLKGRANSRLNSATRRATKMAHGGCLNLENASCLEMMSPPRYAASIPYRIAAIISPNWGYAWAACSMNGRSRPAACSPAPSTSAPLRLT